MLRPPFFLEKKPEFAFFFLLGPLTKMNSPDPLSFPSLKPDFLFCRLCILRRPTVLAEGFLPNDFFSYSVCEFLFSLPLNSGSFFSPLPPFNSTQRKVSPPRTLLKESPLRPPLFLTFCEPPLLDPPFLPPIGPQNPLFLVNNFSFQSLL